MNFHFQDLIIVAEKHLEGQINHIKLDLKSLFWLIKETLNLINLNLKNQKYLYVMLLIHFSSMLKWCWLFKKKDCCVYF